MSDVPQELKYTENHEWVRRREDGNLAVGITDHAQEALGDLVYVELPETGREVKAGEACAVVESVKAAADIYSPVAGTIVEVNEDLADTPELINQDPYGTFIFVLQPQDPAAWETLMDAEGYAKLLSEES
ncbi:MAG: glycine cleavage system protein H [Methylothermaceae bacteria B42]|nr:MAG: glycine cleavage system protein H [Methylothermaceae bacteria B42]HHJ39784.1 glycine cleavage system protein GcvH [Methylothermaceae bacterium]